MVQALLDDAGINYLNVSGRTKSVEVLQGQGRAHRRRGPPAPNPIEDITDGIGVRVITYVQADVTAVADLLARSRGPRRPRPRARDCSCRAVGYASRHLLVAVDASRVVPHPYEPRRRLNASVQIRTVLQHAWAEFEHDIRYKGVVPDEHAFDLDRRFTSRPGCSGSPTRSSPRSAPACRSPSPTSPSPRRPRPPADRVAGPRQVPRRHVLRRRGGRAPTTTAGSPVCCRSSASRRLRLSTVLASVDSAEVTARMDYRYRGAVRRLDDALLAAFGEGVDLAGNAHRRAALEAV